MENLKLKITNFIKYSVNSIREITKGHGNYNKILYLWGLLPSLLMLYYQKSPLYSNMDRGLAASLYVIIALYFIWHLIVIRNTLKEQPEYKVVKKSKKEIYQGLTDEQIKELKRENRKTNIKKFFLLESWDTAPAYTFIICIDAFVGLTQVQYLLQIIK